MSRTPHRRQGGPASDGSPGRRRLAAALLVVTATAPSTGAAPAATVAPDALVARATAGAERAHATGDADGWTRARADVDRALALAPAHPGARRLLPWIQNGQHRFADARTSAAALLAETPDDWWALAQHADACLELGDYAAAEASVDRLAAVRPGPVAWTRVAGLRAVLGDRRGAIVALRLALAATPPAATAARAWTWTDLGTQHLALGALDDAAAAFDAALALDAAHPLATPGLARTRLAQRDRDAALRLATRAAEARPGVATLAFLGDVHAAHGDDAAAARAWEAAGVAERVAQAQGASHGRDAVLLFVDRLADPERALALAAAEAGRRHDVGTLDALAWALHATGRSRAAMRVAHRALRLGTEDASFHYHAGRIAAARGRSRAARRHYRTALDFGAALDAASAAIARAQLADDGRLAKETHR